MRIFITVILVFSIAQGHAQETALSHSEAIERLQGLSIELGKAIEGERNAAAVQKGVTYTLSTSMLITILGGVASLYASSRIRTLKKQQNTVTDHLQHLVNQHKIEKKNKIRSGGKKTLITGGLISLILGLNAHKLGTDITLQRTHIFQLKKEIDHLVVLLKVAASIENSNDLIEEPVQQ